MATKPPAHHLILAIGMPKHGSDAPMGGPPPSVRDRLMPQDPHGAKASPDDAGLVPADNRCGDCEYWHADSGECDKVEGNMTACAGCRKYFSPKGGAGIAIGVGGGDADDMGDMSGGQ